MHLCRPFERGLKPATTLEDSVRQWLCSPNVVAGFSPRSRLNIHGSRADPKLLQVATELVPQRHHQVCDWRFLRCLNVSIALHLSGESTHEQRWKIETRMCVALAHTAAIEDQ